MIGAVVFDLDGTLIQLPIDYEKLFREFKSIMKISDLHPLADVVSKQDSETRKKVFKVWDKAELEALNRMTFKDEGIKIYTRFSKKPKALVTLQGRALVKAATRKLGLSFNIILTREDSLNRTEQLRNAAQKLRKPHENILFVGNTDDDSVAAKKVGCKFLRVK